MAVTGAAGLPRGSSIPIVKQEVKVAEEVKFQEQRREEKQLNEQLNPQSAGKPLTQGQAAAIASYTLIQTPKGEPKKAGDNEKPAKAGNPEKGQSAQKATTNEAVETRRTESLFYRSYSYQASQPLYNQGLTLAASAAVGKSLETEKTDETSDIDDVSFIDGEDDESEENNTQTGNVTTRPNNNTQASERAQHNINTQLFMLSQTSTFASFVVAQYASNAEDDSYLAYR